MGKSKAIAIGTNFNIMYDPKDITAAVKYLAEKNPIPKVTYEKILNAIMEGGRKNAKFADEDHNHDGKWDMSYTGTAGYLILFSLVDYTKNNNYPVILAEVYVSPSFGKSGIIEKKVRT